MSTPDTDKPTPRVKHPSAQMIGRFLGKHFALICALLGLLLLSIPIGALYIAVHFIRKYW